MSNSQKFQPLPQSSQEVESDYEHRCAAFRAQQASARNRQRSALAAALVCIALAIASIFATGHIHFTAFALIPLAVAAYAAQRYLRAHNASRQAGLRAAFYERGLDRIRCNWESLEATGEEFARENHLFQSDLQIIGPRSLYSLLCTTRSQAGAARLADFLLDPVPREESIARQEAVRELLPYTALREEAAVLGKYQFQECDPAALLNWMKMPILRVPAALRVVLFVSGAATLLLAFACLAQFVAWSQVLPALAVLALLQFACGVPFFRRGRTRLRKLRSLTNEFSVLQRGLALLERQSFASPRLKALADQLRVTGAARHIRVLERVLNGITQREKGLFALPALLTAAGTQLVLAIERWRAAHQCGLKEWLNSWSEFEALSAIACYAYEHPSDVFPQLVPGPAQFDAESLGHPLLPAATCVRNNLLLNSSTRFAIVSGSNMAGKSTWLKAIGVNTVLACAGAPVRATRLHISALTICASNSGVDSLLDGKSRFLVEAERLRAILRQSAPERPALFLIDEILGGTNSHDRRVAAESIVRALIGAGAIGLLSTHDLALTQIADLPNLHGFNCSMENDDPSDPLRFDFLVKPGVSRRSSALALLQLIGIPALPPVDGLASPESLNALP